MTVGKKVLLHRRQTEASKRAEEGRAAGVKGSLIHSLGPLTPHDELPRHHTPFRSVIFRQDTENRPA